MNLKINHSSPYDPAHHIQRIFVHESCQDYPYTKEILYRAKHIPCEIIADDATPDIGADAGPYPHNLHIGKRNLLLSLNRGHFFKPCPGTKEYRCCDYQVLNIGMNCPMDCVYCILQAYLNNPWISFFVNIEDLIAELELAFTETNQFWRIGTGEYTDSMALDSITGLSRKLVPFMSDKTTAVLELKSKSAAVHHLKDLTHGGRTIMAWSLNSPAIMKREEIRTASLDERLAAAAQCAEWGYKLAFHFDPIIYHTGWREGYSQTIDALFSKVPSERIVWISMGALRYLPALRSIALSRFPGSRFFQEEFILGLDNKYRYFRELRVEMYSHIVSELRKRISQNTCLYFCMESDEIWKKCGFADDAAQNLPDDLDKAVKTIY